MLNKVLACCVVSLFLVCGFVSYTLATDMGPEEITLVDADSKKPKPAVFPHKKHQETLECADCHHGMSDDGKQVPYVEGQEIKKCASCHNEEVLAGKTSGKNKLDTLKGAGHGNCLECHKENKNAKCSVCHPKQ